MDKVPRGVAVLGGLRWAVSAWSRLLPEGESHGRQPRAKLLELNRLASVESAGGVCKADLNVKVSAARIDVDERLAANIVRRVKHHVADGRGVVREALEREVVYEDGEWLGVEETERVAHDLRDYSALAR